jgi:hypothetical protein
MVAVPYDGRVLVPWTTAWRRCRGVPIATLAEEPLLFAEEQRAPEFNRFAIDAAEPALASRVRTLEVLRMLEQLATGNLVVGIAHRGGQVARDTRLTGTRRQPPVPRRSRDNPTWP